MHVLSAISRVLPPPHFMTLPSVGVDLSDTSLKYMYMKHLRGKGSAVELSAWGEIELPPGAIVEGKIEQVEKIIPALQQVRETCGVEFVRVALPEEHAYIFETTIKRDMPQREVRGLLEFKLEENVPLSPRDAFFDYDVVSEAKDEQSVRAVVTVYGREMVQAYYDACLGARLTPVTFEVESQAIARAVACKGQQGSVMIVDFGKTHTGIGIAYNGTLMHTSTIAVGGQTLSESMRAVLGDTPEEQLTEMKNRHGLRGTHPNDQVRQGIVKVIDKIAAELRSHIGYWNALEERRKEQAITKIVLCGGSANLAGFPEYMTQSLAIPSERAEVWKNVFALDSVVPPIPKRHSYGYATAIGLSLVNVNGNAL